MGCLDDNAISAYLARRLSARDHEAVVEHLSSCDVCLAITCAAGSDAGDARDARVDHGSIGRYQLREIIGQGAMGSVYRAYDPQLDRDVALKVVRSDRFGNAELQARTSREARAMAQVRHPNVISVYDAGELADGVFIAMELVTGTTLARWLAAPGRSWRDIVRMFVAAGRGLVAAHAANIVHRDFKPENVLVDSTGRVVVTDFGVAALRDDLPPAATSLDGPSTPITRTGALLGTPRYMSPEQLRGERVAASSDQFSFAVALYDALYGVPPFPGATLDLIVAAMRCGVSAPPPSSPVPPRVYRVLARALALVPAARFASMTELLDALEAAARPRWSRARWLALGVGVIAAGAAAAAVAAAQTHRASPPWIDPDRRTPVLIAPFANRTGAEDLDDLDASVAAILHGSTRLDAVSGVELRAALANAGLAPDDLDHLAALRPPGPMVLVHGTIERDRNGFTVALDARARDGAPIFTGAHAAATPDGLLDASAALSSELFHALGVPAELPSYPLSTSVAAIHAWSRGQAHAIANEADAAVASYTRALEIDPEFATARAALGLTLYNLQRKPQAIAELERAFHSADRIPERARLTLIGDYYGVVGRHAESILAYQQLLAKWPNDGRTQVNLVSTAIDGNSWPLALEVARGVAKQHPQLEIVRRNLVIAELGNELFTDVVRDGDAMLAEIPRPSGGGIATVAAAYALLGRRADATRLIATIDPELAPRAAADLATYEGRLDDAEAALADRDGAPDRLLLARVRLRRGDRTGALAAATAAMADDSMPGAYLAASLAIEAGDPGDAATKARDWSEAPEADRRLYGQLLAGDLARAGHRGADALAAYRAASRIGEPWLVHDRLARGAIATDNAVDAERELAWCLAHRGQAALVATPSLAVLPEIYLALARSKAARHADPAEVAAAFRTVVELAPHAQRDPVTAEAVRQLR